MSRKLSVGVLLGATVAVAAVVAGYAGGAQECDQCLAVAVVVVWTGRLQGIGQPRLHHRVGPAAAGCDPSSDRPDLAREIWALANAGWKAGSYKIGYQSCDDSTAQTGGWDSGKCATNARLYALNKSVIGVLGTFNSGCAKIEVPILNRANPGPLAIVSPANTNPGITKKWDPGEPQKYYPTGCAQLRTRRRDGRHPGSRRTRCGRRRSGFKKVFVLNDKQTYGFGVATTYKNAAKKLGITVVGFQGWDAKQSSYEALANAIKTVGRAGRLPRRHRVQQRREADAGHQVGQPQDQAADA